MSTATYQEEEVITHREPRRRAASGKLLAGKKALVTGGSRGIGKAVSLLLAEAGAAVAVNFQHSAEAADKVCHIARDFGVEARAYRANIAREEEAAAMMDAVCKDFGGIDILVNNAAITRDKSFLKMTRAHVGRGAGT